MGPQAAPGRALGGAGGGVTRGGLLLGLGVGAAGLVALLAAAGSAEPEHGGRFTANDRRLLRSRRSTERRHPMEWVDRVIERVSEHEGRYDSLNRNTDGAGLSFGILQWAQKTGDLSKLLAAMYGADSELFRQIFGPKWAELLETTRKGSLDPVDGAVLWREPWVSRFRAGGRHPVFQAVQRKIARQGPHFQGAMEASRILGVQTERAMALFFDTSVQQGAGAATKVARQVKDRFEAQGRTTVPYDELLRAYAQRAADRVRTTREPTRPPRSSHLRWVKVGDEWHLFAGSIDLYAGIHRRRFAILRDGRLEDVPVAMA